MRLYISGGITNVSNYMAIFENAEEVLNALGHDTINPASCNKVLASVLSYDEIMEICYKEVDLCDAIVLLPGWEESRGANLERDYALSKEVDVFELADFVEHFCGELTA